GPFDDQRILRIGTDADQTLFAVKDGAVVLAGNMGPAGRHGPHRPVGGPEDEYRIIVHIRIFLVEGTDEGTHLNDLIVQQPAKQVHLVDAEIPQGSDEGLLLAEEPSALPLDTPAFRASVGKDGPEGEDPTP